MQEAVQEAQQVDEEPEGNLIELFVEEAGKTAEAVVPIRWCVDRQLLTKFQQELYPNVCLLVLVSRHQKDPYGGPDRFVETQRHLYPIEQLMAYIQFANPGQHQIHAMVVWNTSASTLYDTYLSSNHRSSSEFLSHTGKWRENDETELERLGPHWGHVGHDMLELNVAKEFFAKEPSAWFANLVNFPYEKPLQDQCHFRRRVLVVLLLFPLSLAAVIIVYAIVLCMRLPMAFWAALLGLRDVRWLKLLSPPNKSASAGDVAFDDMIYSNKWCDRGQLCQERSVFLYDKDGKPRHPIVWCCAPILPVLMLTTLVVSLAISGNAGMVTAYWWPLVASSIGMSLAAGVALAILGPLFRWFGQGITSVGGRLTSVGGRLLKWLDALWPEETPGEQTKRADRQAAKAQRRKLELELERRETQKRQERRETQKRQERAEQYMPLVCTGKPITGKRAFTMNAIPRRNRNLRLRLSDIKAKVCKPYARD